MKPRLNSTQIMLKDLPPEGRDFEFTQESGELTAVLKELIGSNPYRLQIHLQPMGNTYSLHGELKTGMDLQCSLCANDFKLPVQLKLNELIVIERPLSKGDQTSKANHAHEWADSGPNYMVLPNEVFDVAEYAHEAVALAEPIRPLCAPERENGCANAGSERIQRPWLSYGQEKSGAADIQSNPFQVLEKLKLKS
jgi:uncharacterized metal-binding protein YceD (DUF177 family)